jgi:hypothetical protein
VGEPQNEDLKLNFDGHLRLEFKGAKVTTDAGLLAVRELDEALGLTNEAGALLRDSRTGRNTRHDLSGLLRQSVYARLTGYEDVNDQEGSAYNGHFGSACYHPLFIFNQAGDCEAAFLRPGNVHSAKGWRELLEPVLDRYAYSGRKLYFRGDAALASPNIYESLEDRGIL